MSFDELRLPSNEYEDYVDDAIMIDRPLEADIFQYKLALTLWLQLFKSREVDPHYLIRLVEDHGFFSTIEIASTAAYELCNTSHVLPSNQEIRGLLREWTEKHPYDDSEFISLLRFPKRLTTGRVGTDRDLYDFYRHNLLFLDFDDQYDTGCGLYRYVTTRMRHHVASFFTKKVVLKMHQAVDLPLHKLKGLSTKIPTGVCADGSDKLNKVLTLLRRDRMLTGTLPVTLKDDYHFVVFKDYQESCPPYSSKLRFTPIPLKGKACPQKKQWMYIGDSEKFSYALVNTVPKNWDESRVIAEEQVERQVRSGYIVETLNDRLIDWTHGNTNLHDQHINLEAAREGSTTGSLATIDWSHASDGYSIQFARDIFPSEVMVILDQLRAHYLLMEQEWAGGRVMMPNAIFLTMGHRLTPALQSILFTSLSRTAVDVFNALTGSSLTYTDIFVYNDDTIVPTDVAELVIQFGSAIGLTANVRKTFASRENLYRESCGGEFFQGVSLTPIYWPRTRIDLTSRKGASEFYSTLIALQHRIFDYRIATRYLEQVLEDLFPNITYSNELTEDVSDMFDPYRTIGVTWAPYDKDRIVEDDLPECASRSFHTESRGTRPSPREVSPYRVALAEFLTYQDYLIDGPSYSTPLDELLHVSTKRDPKEYYVKEVMQVVRKKK